MKTQIRPLWKDILAAIWTGILLPGLVLHACVLMERKNTLSQQKIHQEVPVRTVKLLRSLDATEEYIDINTYLTGVILAEMPASFEEEALKAQSVAARTYTMKAIITGGKHGDGSVCDDPGCCQGFVDEWDYLAEGGTRVCLDKVSQMVMDTAPMVLEYDGELIEAVYFSSSGGRTESALAVWGADFPYLQSVQSPGEEANAYQNRIRSYTVEEFQERLGIALTGQPENWFSQITHTQGGGVDCVSVCGTEFSGIQLRNLLQLPSTVFSMTGQEGSVRIITNGYGHRVGLSQYGANAMAKGGAGYTEILSHYYPGTALMPME